MADKKTVEKVKELLDGHVYAPLRETAEKWLAEADVKYGDKIDDLKGKAAPAKEKLDELKEKATPAMEKLGDAAEKYSEFAVDANEKLRGVSEKVAVKADEFAEKAAPAMEKLKEKAAPAVDKVLESEFIAKLKEGVASLDEVIETFSKPEMKKAMGEEAAEQIRKHAEEMKAQGKTYCDCPACTKAREILRDLGEDLEEPQA